MDPKYQKTASPHPAPAASSRTDCVKQLLSSGPILVSQLPYYHTYNIRISQKWNQSSSWWENKQTIENLKHAPHSTDVPECVLSIIPVREQIGQICFIRIQFLFRLHIQLSSSRPTSTTTTIVVAESRIG